MIQVADNFNYRGKKPNFDRDSFDTLYDMKNYSENSLDDGHISYCKETGKHYKFNSNNQSDSTTGKWVEQHEAVPADEEDITEQNGTLQLANKTYDKQSFSGLGRVYLRKNIVGNKNVLTQAMINFIYQRSFVLNSGANHNNINFTTLRSGIGSYKKDYSDKNSKYYTIYMQGECNACDINLNITSNNILDSTTENISFIARGILLDQNFSGVNNKFNINREDINLVSSIRNNTLVKDIVKYIDYKDIPTLNMVANLGGVSIEYIKGKPVISGDMYVSKMGTTQERPANIINKGFQYFDTTINKPIFWDGAKWIDATGATV